MRDQIQSIDRGDAAAARLRQGPAMPNDARSERQAFNALQQHCPPCSGDCRQGRDCPAAVPSDPLAAARAMVWSVIVGLSIWGLVALVAMWRWQ